MQIRIPYGHTVQTLEATADEVLESHIQELSAQGSEDETVLAAMASPIGTEKLEKLAEGKKKAVLIISDHTRPVPSKHIVPFMLEAMRRGNPDIDITLLVATGCHRGTTSAELVSKLGEKIVAEEKIAVHDCDESPLTELGVLPSGAHLVVNSLVAEADLVVAEGFIEPHFFAGFSGGRKSILPGICSRVTVLGNHCSNFIASPYAQMGSLEKNPINIDMECAARMAKLQYIVNVIIDEEKRVVAAFAGDVVKAHHAGCEFLMRYCAVKPQARGDIIITSNGGAPLDQNIYQAVKGLTTAEAAAAPGAVLIICAECADGMGGDSFYKALRECADASSLLREILEIPMEKTIPDQWQYQILARILEKHHVIFVTRPELKQEIEEIKMEYAPDLETAYARARELKGSDARLTVIPNGISLIVRF